MRRGALIGMVALPFACSVYGPDNLLGSAGAPENGGMPGTVSSMAGRAPIGGAGNGGGSNPVGGMPTSGGSNGGGTSGTGGVPGVSGASGGDSASAGGSADGGAGPDATTGGTGSGNGGTSPDGGGTGGTSNGGTSNGGTSNGGGTNAGGSSGSGGTSAGGGSGGTSAGGGGTSGTSNGGTSNGGAPPIPGLVAAYPCESASGTVLADTSGNAKNASLANGAGGALAGFSFGAGMVGNALALSASNQAYVSLPRGIVSQLTNLTIATWVKLKSGAAFQRIFDLGVDTNTFMYLTNAGSSGFVRFRIASTPLNKNQALEGVQALPVGKWTHVAVTVGDNGIAIFVDGAQVAQQAPATMRASDMGDTGNNFIGRSPFAADPYLDGQLDEFRIYNRVLSASELSQLAKGQ